MHEYPNFRATSISSSTRTRPRSCAKKPVLPTIGLGEGTPTPPPTFFNEGGYPPSALDFSRGPHPPFRLFYQSNSHSQIAVTFCHSRQGFQRKHRECACGTGNGFAKTGWGGRGGPPIRKGSLFFSLVRMENSQSLYPNSSIVHSLLKL